MAAASSGRDWKTGTTRLPWQEVAAVVVEGDDVAVGASRIVDVNVNVFSNVSVCWSAQWKVAVERVVVPVPKVNVEAMSSTSSGT